MDNSLTVTHFQRPSYNKKINTGLNTRFQVDDNGDPIPRITGLKDNGDYRIDSQNIDFTKLFD
jgi:hypothetical protein